MLSVVVGVRAAKIEKAMIDKFSLFLGKNMSAKMIVEKIKTTPIKGYKIAPL